MMQENYTIATIAMKFTFIMNKQVEKIIATTMKSIERKMLQDILKFDIESFKL